MSPSAPPDPTFIWEAINGYQKTAALKAAIELDLFRAIVEGADARDSIAARCAASPRGIRILCDYLTIAGFLSKDGGRYSLTPSSAVFLDPRSPACLSSVVRFLNSPKLMSAFSDFTETVRRGTTLLPQGGVTEAELSEWVTFAEAMEPIMGPASEFIAGIAVGDGKSPRRVLDIAAGHGRFGIAVALRAPDAQVVAQDWPNVLQVAQKNARAAGIMNRYHLLPGDAFTVDFGEPYDLVLLTNFLHHFDPPACESILKKLYQSLNPGARVITLEFVPNEDRISPPVPASFSMMMLGLTPNGDAYTMEELNRMFSAAGFTHNEMQQVPQSAEQVIVSTK